MNNLFTKIIWSAKQSLVIPMRARIVASKVKWITPYTKLVTNDTDLIVVCVVRNGQEHLKGFIEHHKRVGAKYFVFLDNGSTDHTHELAKRHQDDGVILLECNLKLQYYLNEFKYWLAQTFGNNCWCLIADIDERFDYPYSNMVHIRDFLRYLNSRNYSGVCLQMVDLFTDKAVADWPRIVDIEKQSTWYDHTNIVIDPDTSTRNLALGNKTSNSKIQVLRGGIRKTIFGVEKLQTKQGLLFPSRGTYPISPHWIKNANMADISCALLHYAFDETFPQRCEEIVRRNSHWNNSMEYRNTLSKIKQLGNTLMLKTSSAQKFLGINQLVDEGFLTVSESYLQFVENMQNREHA